MKPRADASAEAKHQAEKADIDARVAKIRADRERDEAQAKADYEASRANGNHTPHVANDGRADVAGNASDAFANRMANLWRGDKAEEPKPAPKDEDDDDDGDDIYAAQRKMAKRNAEKWKQGPTR